MPLSTFLNILAACAGFLSALFFALGTLHLKTKDIVGIAGTYWGFNKHLADSIASQRAEYIFGALLLVLSFSLQLAANLVPSTLQPSLLQSFGFSLAAICLLFGSTGLLSWYLCHRIAERTKAEVRRLLEASLKEQPTK